MEKSGALIGGEGNGGVILYSINKCRDALVAMGLILDYLATSGKTIKELISQYTDYTLIKTKIAATGEISFDKISNIMSNRYINPIFDRRDGLRIDFSDKSWVLVRASNTEPIVRVFAEATNKNKAELLIKEIDAIMRNS